MSLARQSQNTERLLRLARERGVLRPRDVQDAGIDPVYLRRLHQAGEFTRIGRGLYVLAGREPTERHTLAAACARVPHGVVCLLSALQFHEVGTQQPFEIWLAIAVTGWLPHVSELPLRIVRFSGPALAEGIDEHRVEGVAVRVYNVAKTIADCFKYRNKIGLDVALEALRDAWRRRLVTMDELWRYAAVCRVANVMRPYLESLT
jgi:predicted transcriptional regulator of viral defense system